jgi:hypothetical protein
MEAEGGKRRNTMRIADEDCRRGRWRRGGGGESGREREERLNDLLRWQFATIFIFPSGPTALMWS